MKVILRQKQSNSGTIHDIESDTHEREIFGRGRYAVVLASYYGGKGYTTHLSEAGAIRQSRRWGSHSHEIIDENGDTYWVCGDELIKKYS